MKTPLFAFLFLLQIVSTSLAEVKTAKIFSHNMVLQREMNIPVWGSAEPGEKITVSIADFQAFAIADKEGKWKAILPEIPAGGPYELLVKGTNEIILKNVMIGDVWLASGQSNMQWKLKQNVDNHLEEIAGASYPDIRLFTIPNRAAAFPKEDLESGQWIACSPETAAEFSAVAYFFGREIHTQKNIPVGLIDCSWGGTTAEAWTSYEMLYSLPHQRKSIEDILNKKVNWEKDIVPNTERTAKRAEIAANSNLALQKGVTKANFGDFEWNIVNVNEWNKDIEGVIWLRKAIEIAGAYKKQDLVLHMGKPHGTAQVYFNESKIGEVTGPRSIELKVPGELVKSGGNQITLRLASPRYKGFLSGEADQFFVATSTGAKIADLSGEWKYNEKLEPELPPIQFYYRYPAALFNGMVNPISAFGIKGVIWYQGENNVDNAEQYQTLFPALIEDWRIRWKQGYFPFLYVQLANYGDPVNEPSESKWAALREAQLMALDLPNTGMAVAIDLGDQFNIHPGNKQDVGKRLAFVARSVAYGENITWKGPVYKSMSTAGKEIALTFHDDSYDGGLIAKDGELQGFSIAGEDRKFYWATARIVGGKIYVSSEKVSNPVAVRYGWADNPAGNLYNKKGFPASPFRTDKW